MRSLPRVAVGLVLGAAVVRAQTDPSFEVASIRANTNTQAPMFYQGRPIAFRSGTRRCGCSAVQEQLGLRLEPRRGTRVVLVIERVERPALD
jgi:hypothetical protein